MVCYYSESLHFTSLYLNVSHQDRRSIKEYVLSYTNKQVNSIENSGAGQLKWSCSSLCTNEFR